jgi:phytol kinase
VPGYSSGARVTADPADRKLADGPPAIEPVAGLIPSPADVAVAVPVAMVAALMIGRLVSWLRRDRRVAVPYTRKLFHIGIFSIAAGVHALRGAPAVVVYGGVVALFVLHATWRGDGHPLFEALARTADAPRRALFVIVPLVTTAIGGLAASLRLPRFAAVGYLVAGWGDAAGEPVGQRWGRHRYRVLSLAGVPATRSIEGSLAVFAVGTVAAVPALIAADVSSPSLIAAAFAAGAAGALVEAVSNHGLDNLTVQLAAAGAAAFVAG